MQLTLSYLAPAFSLSHCNVSDDNIIINQDPVQANRKLYLEKEI